MPISGRALAKCHLTSRAQVRCGISAAQKRLVAKCPGCVHCANGQVASTVILTAADISTCPVGAYPNGEPSLCVFNIQSVPNVNGTFTLFQNADYADDTFVSGCQWAAKIGTASFFQTGPAGICDQYTATMDVWWFLKRESTRWILRCLVYKNTEFPQWPFYGSDTAGYFSSIVVDGGLPDCLASRSFGNENVACNPQGQDLGFGGTAICVPEV
jgi:hypothetical protein